ncbi:hypothetical protein FRB98_005894 [Tulasnella sp. 332]|nr:hypothetical protein FRB98_005894 [Tulasnella sp. 332]
MPPKNTNRSSSAKNSNKNQKKNLPGATPVRKTWGNSGDDDKKEDAEDEETAAATQQDALDDSVERGIIDWDREPDLTHQLIYHLQNNEELQKGTKEDRDESFFKLAEAIFHKHKDHGDTYKRAQNDTSTKKDFIDSVKKRWHK